MASAKLASPADKAAKKAKKEAKAAAAAKDDIMNGDASASAKKEKKDKKDKKRKLEDGEAASAGKKEAAGKKAAAAAAATPNGAAAAAAAGDADRAAKKSKKDGDKDAASAKGAAAAPTVADASSLDNFPQLADSIKSLLRSRGIETLFPIQSACLDHALQGFDVVGRARTGCGKTLAFVLPIVQALLSAAAAGGAAKRAFGRKPLVVVLAPTRELAKQVHADFEYVGKGANLTTLCLYGGTQYGPQESMLRRGVDVVVGTPGRVKDHLERGTLDLTKLRFRVLDECDEMLNMGFVDDVEKILNAGRPAGAGDGADGAGAEGGAPPLQTLLFSATMPSWVKDITRRFLRKGHKLVDLVGDSKIKAATTVRHLMLPAHWTQRAALVTDLVKCWGCGGRSIVFTETKNDANELAGALYE